MIRTNYVRYVFAIALVAVSLGANLALYPYLERSLFFLSLTAVAISALVSGRGPGFLATLLSAVALNYFFLGSKSSFDIQGGPELLRLGMFLVAAASLTWLGSSYKMALAMAEREKQRAEKAAAEAKRATQLRDDFVAILSHDLKNPITAISLKAELLMKSFHSESSTDLFIRKNAEGIMECAQWMHRMIGNLLDLAKIDAGHFVVKTTPQEISSSLRKIGETFEPIAEKKSIQLRVISLQPAWANCDSDRIFQVLSNLVGNAIKFSSLGGSVTLHCTANNNQILVAITDTGPGISEEHLPHIFNRYWQAQTTAQEGTGLGLAISKGIVEAHGGRIWVKSKVGEGSTFWISIPKAQPASIVQERKRIS